MTKLNQLSEKINQEFIDIMPENIQKTVALYFDELQDALTRQAENPGLMDEKVYVWRGLRETPSQSTLDMIEWIGSLENVFFLESNIERKLARVIATDKLMGCEYQTVIASTDDEGGIYVTINIKEKYLEEYEDSIKGLKPEDHIRKEFRNGMPENVKNQILLYVDRLDSTFVSLFENQNFMDGAFVAWEELAKNEEADMVMAEWLKNNVAPEKEECTARKLLRVIDLFSVNKPDSMLVEVDDENGVLEVTNSSILWDELTYQTLDNYLVMGRFAPDFLRWPVLD